MLLNFGVTTGHLNRGAPCFSEWFCLHAFRKHPSQLFTLFPLLQHELNYTTTGFHLGDTTCFSEFLHRAKKVPWSKKCYELVPTFCEAEPLKLILIFSLQELGSSMIESFSWNVETHRSHAPHPAASLTFQGSPDPRCSQQIRRMTAKISLVRDFSYRSFLHLL